LGFIGISDVEFVYAEGLAISPESREAGLAKAAAEIARLAA
jgi:FMN-dependent NADH-azoreductase